MEKAMKERIRQVKNLGFSFLTSEVKNSIKLYPYYNPNKPLSEPLKYQGFIIQYKGFVVLV